MKINKLSKNTIYEINEDKIALNVSEYFEGHPANHIRTFVSWNAEMIDFILDMIDERKNYLENIFNDSEYEHPQDVINRINDKLINLHYLKEAIMNYKKVTF